MCSVESAHEARKERHHPKIAACISSNSIANLRNRSRPRDARGMYNRRVKRDKEWAAAVSERLPLSEACWARRILTLLWLARSRQPRNHTPFQLAQANNLTTAAWQPFYRRTSEEK